MKQIQHIISRITLALMRKGCGGGLPKVFQVVLLVTLFSLPNGRAGVGLTFAQELPDDSISTKSVTAVAGNKTYVFKHKATGKWLINNGGTLALSDVQPVSSTKNKYQSEIFQTNGEGIISFALTDINDPNSGVIIDQDTEGGILLAPRRNTEAQSATVCVKGNNGLYLTVYKGKVYGVKNTDSNATQWYAYEVTSVGHHFENGSCIYEGCSEQITHRVPTYNTAGDATSGIASWSTTLCMETVVPVTSSTSQVTLNAGWYHVSGNVTLTQGAVCNGAVHLILCDGAKLTVSNSNINQAGINVSGTDNSLTIYAQSEGSSMGALSVTSGEYAAGIGSGNGFQTTASTTNITINGGTVTATGGTLSAGIGGGYDNSGNNITINGGTVQANGGNSGAGIGGGQKKIGQNITINGGEVTAYGGNADTIYGTNGGAGIGGGEGNYGQFITINGGTVTANGGTNAAGIGGGYKSYGSDITINGGTVTATGGKYNSYYGAGIGNGYGCETNPSNIHISTTLTTLAGTSANPTYEIANNGGDLASLLADKQYVTVHLPDFDDNGFCTICGGYQPATQVTAGNCEALGLSSAYKDYYAIQNAGQLYWFADKVNKSSVTNYCKLGSAVLTADIIINDGTFADNGTFTPKGATSAATPRSWTPIVAGASSPCYKGTFDGNGHTISGLYYKNTNTEYVGFIGCALDATIKNLGLENMYIHGNSRVGGICGYPKRTTISNCYTTGIIKGEYDSIGGICGVSAYAENVIINCYSTCKASTLSQNDKTAGGISGELSHGIKNCYSTQTPAIGGTVTSTTLDEAMVQRFQSGEIAYLLNGSRNKGTEQSPLVWAQNLETQSLPVLGKAGVHYTRTMTDEWGTLVVPFAVSAAPEGFEFYGIRSMGDNNELYLRKVTSSIEAGTPVFVHRTGSGTSLELTASNETVNTTLATASGTALQGTYAAVALNKTDNPNAYFVYNEKLYSTQKLGDANHVTINPFRAYLVTPVASEAKQLVFVIDSDATSVEEIENGTSYMVNGTWYNLQGQKLAAPRKGINIVNGKKVLVK